MYFLLLFSFFLVKPGKVQCVVFFYSFLKRHLFHVPGYQVFAYSLEIGLNINIDHKADLFNDNENVTSMKPDKMANNLNYPINCNSVA